MDQRDSRATRTRTSCVTETCLSRLCVCGTVCGSCSDGVAGSKAWAGGAGC